MTGLSAVSFVWAVSTYRKGENKEIGLSCLNHNTRIYVPQCGLPILRNSGGQHLLLIYYVSETGREKILNVAQP